MDTFFNNTHANVNKTSIKKRRNSWKEYTLVTIYKYLAHIFIHLYEFIMIVNDLIKWMK